MKNRISASLSIGLLAVGCSGAGSGVVNKSSSESDSLAQSTSPEAAKNILSMYGYSAEEFWKIVDKVRADGNIMFLPSYSPMGLLLLNCVHVATDTETTEKIELVNEACRVDFLFERKKTVSGSAETIDITYRMKLKNDADREHFQFNSLECHGQAVGSSTASDLDVTAAVDCKVVDSFYGSFEASHKYRITGLEQNMKISAESVVTSSGSKATELSPGAAKITYELDFSAPEKSFFTFNGEKDGNYRPEWQLGMRIN